MISSALQAKSLWYLTMGTGVVSLVLLTVVVALGIAGSVGKASPTWPRFVTQRLHRNLSLLAVSLLVVHIATAVLDPFAPIRWIDALLPFVSRYRPVWLGLGALALDLMIALIATSLLRDRLGYRSWRLVHWLAYACWPVALLHAIGTGTSTKETWMLAVYAACTAVVLWAIAWRAAHSSLARETRWVPVLASLAATAIVAVWLVLGPMRPGWARAAGTPPALLKGSAPVTALRASLPSEATFTGTTTQTDGPTSASVQISGTVATATPMHLEIDLQGTPRGDALLVNGGTVWLGPATDPQRFAGGVTTARGGTIAATLTGPAGVSDQMVATLSAQPDGVTQGQLRFGSGAPSAGFGTSEISSQ